MKEILPITSAFRKLDASIGREGTSVLLAGAIVVIVGVGAFGLGRLTALREQKSRLVIYAPDRSNTLSVPIPRSENNTPELRKVASGAHNFVASKNGSKYYPAGCSSASRIKPANEVWFETGEAALSAGYTPASGCNAVQ